MKSRFAIKFESPDTVFWVKLDGIDNSIDFSYEFCRECLMDEEQADDFLSRPSLDPRYKKKIIELIINDFDEMNRMIEA